MTKLSLKKMRQFKFNIYNYKYFVLFAFGLLLLISSCFARQLGFNKGVDFSGGVVIESYCKDCNVTAIVNQINKKAGVLLQNQRIKDGFLLKTSSTDSTEKYEKLMSAVKEVFKKNNAKLVSKDFVSPQMTRSFIDDSIFACVFAFFCIGIYVIVRFNFKFAISAIIALVYDVLMVICFISFFRIEVCLITLTAILTIIGYCINDKIVVFDRIRENLSETNKKVPDIIKESVACVITRSILTSLTTCIATISLLFFGDRLIYELGITIIFGIFVGTISSILLAPSLLLAFNVKHIRRISNVKDPMWYTS